MQPAARTGRDDVGAVAHQADHLHADLVQGPLDLAQGHGGNLAVRGDTGLGQVGAGLESLDARLFARRHQPPADEHDEQHAGQGHRPADRQEVEHGKTVQPFAAVAETGDDQVRRGADEGGGAAEDGAEGERHEHLARRQPEPAGELDGDRHEQGQRTDIVHEAGQHRSQRHQHADTQGRPGLGRQHHPGERVHRARGLQSAAEHEHAGYRHHGRVTETGKGLVGRHQPGHHAGEQRTGGHHVVPPPAPEKHGHRGDQDDEDVDLAGGNGWFRGWWSECQNAD